MQRMSSGIFPGMQLQRVANGYICFPNDERENGLGEPGEIFVFKRFEDLVAWYAPTITEEEAEFEG